MLNVASRLRVPADYGEHRRAVFLDGEAQFRVVHDEAKPFMVTAGGTVTRDIGTVFNVRAYPGALRTTIVVAEGSVSVQSETVAQPAATTLLAGEAVHTESDGTLSVETHPDIARYLAWTRGELVFNDTPMADALAELARWYNLDFRIADHGLAKRRLTMTVRSTAVTSDVLADIAAAIGARVERRGERGRVIIFESVE
jgi:ferric-dicitrate binding protein FerR (iron transport regulator)